MNLIAQLEAEQIASLGEEIRISRPATPCASAIK